ncbi:hypothetical protein Plhal304r1_c022g0077851 [Plasmopara halstedii]
MSGVDMNTNSAQLWTDAQRVAVVPSNGVTRENRHERAESLGMRFLMSRLFAPLYQAIECVQSS